MRGFAGIVLGYFVIGAVMFGGGAVNWDNVGIPSIIMDVSAGGDVSQNTTTVSDLEQMGGPIQESQTNVSGGGLLAVIAILFKIIGFFFWPIAVLVSHNAPVSVIVLGGGTPVIAMLGSIVMLVTRS